MASTQLKKTLFAQCILFNTVDFSFTTQVDIFVYDSFKMLSIGRMFFIYNQISLAALVFNQKKSDFFLSWLHVFLNVLKLLLFPASN